jgi:hypothetical protein
MSVRTFALVAGLATVLAACSSSEDPGNAPPGGSGGGAPAGGGRGGGGAPTPTAGAGGGTAGSGGSPGRPDAAGSRDAPRVGDGGPARDGGGSDGGGSAYPPQLPPSNSPITQGFTDTPFTFVIQSPHRLPQAERYTYDPLTNTHTCWVGKDDSSFQAGNNTDPRTELRWQQEWTSGQHMLEADVWIAPTTHRTSIVQVFSTNPPTTFMLTAWRDRTLRYYFGTGNGPVIMRDAFDRWFNLKVLHDVGAKTVTVFIDDVKAMSFRDKGTHWHFKNGNYGCDTDRCETRWRNLRYWTKK